MSMDYGLSVVYNADGKYTLMMDGIVKEYPVGGLMCEYARLHPVDIKDIILSCSNLDKQPTTENIVDFLSEFNKNLHAKFHPVQAVMICLEFMNTSIDWAQSQRNGNEDEFLETITGINNCDEIKKYIFEGTPYQNIGRETVLQQALSCYLSFASSFVITKMMFLDIIQASDTDGETRESRLDVFSALYGNYIDFQHIDYRIISLEDGLNNFYTIRSSVSLLLFDIANSIKNEVDFSRCPNCNQIFVPEGRSDILYCSYPSPQNSDKTCREIGAQITRANKEKNDVVTKEYRRVYMRLQMTVKRHPENPAAKKQFARLTEEIKSWRQSLNDGTATVDDYLSWLKEFE